MKKVKKEIQRKEQRDPDWVREELEEDLGWLDELAALIEKDEARMVFVNETREKELKSAEEILRQVVQGKEVEINESLHDPLPSMGCVSVIGREIVIEDTERFLEAAGLASNLDIFPRADGSLEMDFTFHGLMMKGGIVR